MAKLTKAEAKMHAEAEQLLAKPDLTHEDKLFIFEHWQESANHVNSAAGAFFTPFEYAMDVALEIGQPGARVLDLCAGIGTLTDDHDTEYDGTTYITPSILRDDGKENDGEEA